MRKVLRGYAKNKKANLFPVGTMPVPFSKDKCPPATRRSFTEVGLTLKLCCLIAALLAVAGTISPAVASNDRLSAVSRHRVHAVHRSFGGHRRQMPLYGYHVRGQYVPGTRDTLIYGPGYVFVPGHGILDEDCDMPTSTCSNEYRPVK
jgi:hypothetical protein